MNLRERSDGRSQGSLTQGHTGLHTKLSDDELVSQFSGRSLSEKLEIFKRVLRQSHQTFDDLIKAWIHDTPGDNYGPLRQRKANRILDLIWQDESGLLPLFEKTESFKERIAISTAKVIRSELDVLNTKVKVFGRFDPTMNPEELNLRDVLRGIKEHAPNTFRLLNQAAESRKRQGQDEEHDPHGRIVTVVSILGLGRARITANYFARILGLYLYTAGIPRRALTLLNNLGVTDSYNSIRRAVKTITLNSQST
jgi:hypothetical protein